MSNEPSQPEDVVVENNPSTSDESSAGDTSATHRIEEKPESTTPEAEPNEDKPNDSGNLAAAAPANGPRHNERPETRLHQILQGSPAAIVNTISGSHNHSYNTYFGYHQSKDRESQLTLDGFITIAALELSNRAYKSLDVSQITAHSGALLSERILLVSCHDEDIAGNVARSIACETKIPAKELVTIDQNGQGDYNFKNFIEALARSKEKRKAVTDSGAAICVWEVSSSGEDEISTQILDSLLSNNARIAQYKSILNERGLCLICLVSPQRIQAYVDSRTAAMRLRSWEIDFLSPLLEEYDFSDYDILTKMILQQRQEQRWSNDNAEFYKQINKCLRAQNLRDVLETRPLPQRYDLNVEDLFDWEDPLTRTVLYCATYFPDLSPQDFSYLVELFLGDTTEEVTKRVKRADNKDASEITEVVESVPLEHRWKRDADAVLRKCKLASTKNENHKRVVDFKLEGLRTNLSEYIRNEHYFFFESNFVLLRQRGLLFSPRKIVAEGARQLFVDMAAQYAAADVANWLYDILAQFEQVAEAAERLKEHRLAFQSLPDLQVEAARRYLSFALSRLLIKLDKEEPSREAARLFWQQLLQHQHQWLLLLLRRMGDSAPFETLKWVKQLLDQGRPEIRDRTLRYLVSYLLHREPTIYATVKELMQWSKPTQAGQIAQEVLIIYCIETNRQVDQEDYGQWPSSHPLFGFKDLKEAEDSLDLLVGWVCSAASEVDPDRALFLIADILAGWYFILSPLSQDNPAEATAEVTGETDLNARLVRALLFEVLGRHIPRFQRTGLAAVWEQLKDDMLDQVLFVDSLINEVSDESLNVELLTNAAEARRKLLEARASLGKLREAFISCTAQATAA